MIKDDTYLKQVNRRLTAARLLLAASEEAVLSKTPMERQANIESSLLQLYFAVCSYLNELLSYYHKPAINHIQFDLARIFAEGSDLFSGVQEFRALQQWNTENDNALLALAQYPIDLLTLESPKQNEEADLSADNKKGNDTSGSALSLIAISSEVTTFDLMDTDVLKNFLNSFQALIDSQRANQSEY